jgi:hypothetical protein
MQAGPDQYTSDTMRLIAAWAGAASPTVTATAATADPATIAFFNMRIPPFVVPQIRFSARWRGDR